MPIDLWPGVETPDAEEQIQAAMDPEFKEAIRSGGRRRSSVPRRILAFEGFPKVRSVFRRDEPEGYDVVVEEVHDADTVALNIDLGFGVFTGQWVRLENVWAPELWTPEGKAAQEEVERDILPLGSFARLYSTTYLKSFDRVIGRIVLLGETPEEDLDVNAEIVRRGLATTARLQAIVEQLGQRTS